MICASNAHERERIRRARGGACPFGAGASVCGGGCGAQRVAEGRGAMVTAVEWTKGGRLLQVNLLEWLAKELSGWDYFAPVPRGKPDPKQMLLSISAAHKVIRDYEWQQTAPESGWLDDATAAVAEVRPCSHTHTVPCWWAPRKVGRNADAAPARIAERSAAVTDRCWGGRAGMAACMHAGS